MPDRCSACIQYNGHLPKISFCTGGEKEEHRLRLCYSWVLSFKKRLGLTTDNQVRASSSHLNVTLEQTGKSIIREISVDNTLISQMPKS